MQASKQEQLIRAQDWIYENAGTRWEDGLILGNGDMGVIGYAPYGLEWVLNKGDVFDGRLAKARYWPHDRVMAKFRKERLASLMFLNEVEKPKGPDPDLVTQSAALLR